MSTNKKNQMGFDLIIMIRANKDTQQVAYKDTQQVAYTNKKLLKPKYAYLVFTANRLPPLKYRL